MKKYLNGKLMEMTPAEITSLEAARADAAKAKRDKPPPPPTDMEVLTRALNAKGIEVTEDDLTAARKTFTE